jgi:hypothetical protein
MPPPAEIDLQARGLFWDDEEPLHHDEGGQFIKADKALNLPTQMRGYVQSDANTARQSAVPVRAFSDARIDALLQQKREAETVQALGRLRLVHAGCVRPVFLVSNLPAEIPVDRFVAFSDVMPDTLERVFLAQGSVPTTPLGLLKLRPDLATTEAQAKKVMQRSKLKTSAWLSGLPYAVRLAIVELTFKARNAGKTRDHSQLFLTPPPANVDGSGCVVRLPVKEWVRQLEKGYTTPEKAGGWGALKTPSVVCFGDKTL